MTVSLWAASSMTPTVGTETFVPSVSAVGVYIFYVDTASMVAGDAVELRSYQMILTGCTAKVFTLDAYQGLQPVDDQIKGSIPISNDLTDASAVRFSIKQTLPAGSARQFPWKVVQHT